MKTATPPKGVTARWVSRRITRSPESRAVISDRIEVTANLLHQTNLLQIRNENRDPTEGRHRSLGLTQNHPLAREQSSDFRSDRGDGEPAPPDQSSANT